MGLGRTRPGGLPSVPPARDRKTATPKRTPRPPSATSSRCSPAPRQVCVRSTKHC
jgi:hypothetical protein